ncbi:MAG: two-component system sensor histidine kinase NtrB [Chitinispirillaceae bacterium]
MTGIKRCEIDQLMSELHNLHNKTDRLQENLDRIANISSAIIYVLDKDGCFTFVNRAVEEILNFTPDELIGRHFSTIMTKEEFRKVSRNIVLPRIAGKVTGIENAPKLFDERRTGKRRTRNMEIKLLTKKTDDMRILVGDVTGIVEVEGAYRRGKNEIRSKSENFLGSQGVIFDITKYKKAERERLELQKRLFELQKMDAIGKLAGKVAHDLNNKLGSIIGSAEILKQDFGKKETDPSMFLDTILSASRHAAELSNRLLEFSRKGESGYANVNIHELIDNVMEFVKPIKEENISIHRILLSLEPTVMGCSNQLQNALLNLVLNACDAITTGGGVLTVETTDVLVDENTRCSHSFQIKSGKYLMITIQDTGIGMDESVMCRLFEPFFTTKTVGKGIGLGLVSVRDCVKNHGGFINVDSEPGKGSRFEVYLPRYY